MSHRPARPIAAALAAVLVLFAGACSSGGDGTSATTTKAKTSTTKAASSTTADLAAEASKRETVSDKVATTEHTVTITAAGRFKPDIVQVKVGEPVSFVVEKGRGVAVITFDGTTIYPVNEGTPVSFTFAQPANQTVTDIDSEETGTVSISK